MFELFLRSFLKEDYEFQMLSATTIKHGGRRKAFHYYINESREGIVEIMINQIDEWVSEQGGAVNNYESLVENILDELGIEDAKNVSFTVIIRDGIKEDDYFTIRENKEHKPTARFQRLQIGMKNIAKFTGDRYIYVDLDIMYKDIKDCNREFNMVKLFLNSLQKKVRGDMLSARSQKDIYEHYELSEQTFYSWKKKNPAVFEAICDGYLYKDIKEIVNALADMPSLCNENWGTHETMKHLDGTEF